MQRWIRLLLPLRRLMNGVLVASMHRITPVTDAESAGDHRRTVEEYDEVVLLRAIREFAESAVRGECERDTSWR